MTHDDILRRLAILETQVAELQGHPIASTRKALPAIDPAGNIPRGQYIGMAHDKVVELDPWYVQWLAEKGKAAGLGFTDEQIETAVNDPRPQPPRGRR
jgi:hypothetical protein